MKIKKIKGSTMPEVMQIVRRELGEDAVILNSKVIHEGGFLGLFKKRKLEVLAGIDSPRKKPVPSKPVVAKPMSSVLAEGKQDHLLKEIKDMKRLIQQKNQDHTFPLPYQELLNHLENQEVNKDIAMELVDTIHTSNEQEEDMEKLKKKLAFEIKHRLANKGSFGKSDYQKQFVHLVGPTGVGKTTTIAKLAAHSVLNERKKVALITTDTYRIAAIEQLKTYSKILDVPIEVAYNLEDYNKAREKFSDFDLVFVDTAGRNFRDEKYVEELGNVMDLNEEVDTYLVLSLTTKSNDLEAIYDQFRHVPVKQIIFTKKDETTSYGAALNLSLQHNIGIAFLTTGQDVPDDIEEASIDHIAKLIVGD
ncbi:flagellar biosynthesis protein FlhF [Gracilibacillus dipsosauri]|uniref:flagellar biosynthesis protein FlhF n=1 Tax=Gracilibacillus dipsosauri TaxID=178340 RepID=UPI002409DB84